MTTLIDRITKRIDELKKSTCTKSIVDELERVKAELTAVNGVDELIKILKSVIENASINMGYEMQLRKVLKYLKSLKQTPVNDSQPKEVEIKKIKNVYQDCPNCEQDNCLILNDMNYCPGCGSKIKWIV